MTVQVNVALLDQPIEVELTDTTVTVSVPTHVVAIAGTDLVGPRGPAGPAGGIAYVHEQPVAAAEWFIAHNLGGWPGITTVQLVGPDEWEVIEGDVLYLDDETISVNFGSLVAGRAFLS